MCDLKNGKILFSAWCSENLHTDVDFNTVSASDINKYLRTFYAEAQSKQRNCSLTEEQAQEYHKNTIKKCKRSFKSPPERHWTTD